MNKKAKQFSDSTSEPLQRSPSDKQQAESSEEQIINDFIEKRRLQQEALRKIMAFMDNSERSALQRISEDTEKEKSFKDFIITRIRNAFSPK